MLGLTSPRNARLDCLGFIIKRSPLKYVLAQILDKCVLAQTLDNPFTIDYVFFTQPYKCAQNGDLQHYLLIR
jgi:hypothetical protein